MGHKKDDLGVLSREGACAMVGVSMHTLDRMIKDGRFPTGVRLGSTSRSRVVWKIEVVEAWLKKNAKVDGK